MTYFSKTVAAALLGLTCGVAADGVAGEPPAVPDVPREELRPPEPKEAPRCRPGSNVIIIDNGGRGSSTVIDNAANGAGKRLVVVDGQVISDTPAVAPGKALKFGDVKFYSPLHQCTLYWGPKTLTWYRYDRERQEYVPAEWD